MARKRRTLGSTHPPSSVSLQFPPDTPPEHHLQPQDLSSSSPPSSFNVSRNSLAEENSSSIRRPPTTSLQSNRHISSEHEAMRLLTSSRHKNSLLDLSGVPCDESISLHSPSSSTKPRVPRPPIPSLSYRAVLASTPTQTTSSGRAKAPSSGSLEIGGNLSTAVKGAKEGNLATAGLKHVNGIIPNQPETMSNNYNLESFKKRQLGYVLPGPGSESSSTCQSSLPPASPDAMAPLHIVIPTTLPYGKLIISPSPLNPKQLSTYTKEYSAHHYYFNDSYPSANNLFSRMHGFCNQSPSWLVLDVGYIACREHQVAVVVDAFQRYAAAAFDAYLSGKCNEKDLKVCLQDFMAAERNASRKFLPGSGSNRSDFAELTYGKLAASKANSKVTAPTTEKQHFYLPRPIRLKCNGIRLRDNNGSGWYLYETPIQVCSEEDKRNFNFLIHLIESFIEFLKDSRLCQNASMKPFMNQQFAIVVLKQEGIGVPTRDVARMTDFCCEGVELSEIRLVRHKLMDKFGNSLFEKDPRFSPQEVYGRPIACNKSGLHGRYVFAPAALPRVLKMPLSQLGPQMLDVDSNDSDSD